MKTAIAPLRALTERESRFAEHLAVFDDPAAAYLASGECSSGDRVSIRQMAYALKGRPHVRARVIELRNQIAAAGPQATRAALVRDLQESADVDVADEIVRVAVVHCPDCYSSPAYADQWPMLTAAALDAGAAELPPEPMSVGLFDPDRKPWSHCARCLGAGRQVTHYTPWDQLSPAARRCLRGVECYGDGTLKKVLIADLSAIREQLHRTVPGFYAPAQSVALNLHADIKPLRRDMTIDEVVAAFEAISPTEALPAPDDAPNDSTIVSTDP